MIGIEETPLYNDIRGKMESHYTVEGVLLVHTVPYSNCVAEMVLNSGKSVQKELAKWS